MKKSLLLPLLFLLSGCATTSLNYHIDDTYSTDTHFNFKVAVNSFQDSRPEDEKLKDIGHERIGFYTNDETFKNNAGGATSECLLNHLKQINIFSSIDTVDFPFDLETSPEQMKSLSDKGYDFAITANMVHCVGFQLSESSGGAEFGALGILADAMANPRTVGAKVEYNPIKIIDLKNQRVIWCDSVEYNYEKKVTFYSGPNAYLIDGLKGANNKFIKELVTVLNKNIPN